MKTLRPYQQKALNETLEALKKNNEPVLLMASVGAGKSLMIAKILLLIEKAGKRALCLVNNAELVRNNAAAYVEEGGSASIFCASLNSKETSNPIVFGTPQSVLNGIKNKKDISQIIFNLIIVDECHMINYKNKKSTFMQILRHYKSLYDGMRLLGATGTNYRFKGSAIVGEKCLFKTQVGNITMKELLDQGYLIKPRFEVDENHVIDFSSIKPQPNGLFNSKELQSAVDKDSSLTKKICVQLMKIMEEENRFGVFVFATTKRHAREILSYLPQEQSALILGETPQEERDQVLTDARNGKIKYLVNIAIISVGVDVPPFDTIAYLRPTESLVLLVQTLGRALRLSEKTNKRDALVLDFSGNLERHQDYDDPVLLSAIKNTLHKDHVFTIPCPQCNNLNPESARRCIGEINNKRCLYFFQFRNCDACGQRNDVASRECFNCKKILINPDDKLALNLQKIKNITVYVLRAKYNFYPIDKNTLLFYETYWVEDDEQNQRKVVSSFRINSKKSKNVFYGSIMKKLLPNASTWFPFLFTNLGALVNMLKDIVAPQFLVLTNGAKGLKITKRIFENDKQK